MSVIIGLGLCDDSREIKDVGQIPLTWCLLSALLGYPNREFSFVVLPALALFVRGTLKSTKTCPRTGLKFIIFALTSTHMLYTPDLGLYLELCQH